jgi:hypothetical protein
MKIELMVMSLRANGDEIVAGDENEDRSLTRDKITVEIDTSASDASLREPYSGPTWNFLVLNIFRR